MATKGTVTVRIVGDSKDLEAALGRSAGAVDKFEKKTEQAGKKLTDTGKKMSTFASIPVAAAMGAAAKSASDLEQAVGGVESVFGDASDKITEFGENAAATTGLSKRQVNEMAAVIGASLQGLGFNADEAASQVLTLESRAADMAATFGGDTETAIQAVSSALRGERDPIERYGVSIKEADVQARILALGLDTSTLAAQKKSTAVATLDLVMGQTAKTEGQFAREAEGAAGSLAIARAEMENAAAEIGANLLPLIADVASGVSDVAGAFGRLPEPAQNAILAMAGVAVVSGPILTVVGNVQKLQAKLGDLGTAGATANKFIGGLGTAGVVGAAIVGLDALHGSLTDISGELDELSRQTTGDDLIRHFNEAADGVSAGLTESLTSIDVFGERIWGNESGLRDIEKRSRAFDQLMASNTGAAERLVDALRADGQDVTEFENRLREAAEANELNAEAAELNASASGELAGTLDDLSDSTVETEGATSRLVGSVGDAVAAIGEQTDAAGDAAEAMEDLLDSTLAVFDADIGYRRSVDSTEDAIRDLTAATMLDAEAKGEDAVRAEDLRRATLDAEEAILRQADAAAEAAIQAYELAGGSLDAAQKATIQKDELIKVRDTLAPGSPLRTAIDGYITRLGEVPATKATTVTVDVSNALANLDTVLAKIGEVGAALYAVGGGIGAVGSRLTGTAPTPAPVSAPARRSTGAVRAAGADAGINIVLNGADMGLATQVDLLTRAVSSAVSVNGR